MRHILILSLCSWILLAETPVLAETTEQTQPPDEAEQSENSNPEDENASSAPQQANPTVPNIVGIRGSSIGVAFVRNIEGVRPGTLLTADRSLTLGPESCLRLVSVRSVSLSICGPAEIELGSENNRLMIHVLSGRGMLTSLNPGSSIRVSGRLVFAQNSSVYFDTSQNPTALMLAGELAGLDGQAFERSPSPPQASDVLSSNFCTPETQRLTFAIGDPNQLVAATAQRRAQDSQGEQEGATTEGGATCVDSAGGAASDPSQSGDGGIDPDARQREPGTLRVIIRLPERR